jgi:hypothetical protein
MINFFYYITRERFNVVILYNIARRAIKTKMI